MNDTIPSFHGNGTSPSTFPDIYSGKNLGGFCRGGKSVPLWSDIFSPECTRQVTDENNIPDTPDDPERYLQSLVILDIHQLLV